MSRKKPVSNQIKQKAIDEVRNGESIRHIGSIYGIPMSTLHKWCADVGVHSKYKQKRTSDRKIIQCIRSHPYVSRARLEVLLGFSHNSIKQRMEKLVIMKRIDYIISHNTHLATMLYFVIKDDRRKNNGSID